MPRDMMDMGMEDDEEYSLDSEEEMDGEHAELGAAAREAFPDEDWSPERLSALKEMIRLCKGGGMGMDDEYEEDDEPKKSKGGPMLGLVFGAGPKKK